MASVLYALPSEKPLRRWLANYGIWLIVTLSSANIHDKNCSCLLCSNEKKNKDIFKIFDFKDTKYIRCNV